MVAAELDHLNCALQKESRELQFVWMFWTTVSSGQSSKPEQKLASSTCPAARVGEPAVVRLII